MIKYRVCVDLESDWFEYRNTFEEAVQVLRDLFEEDGKVFYNGFTHWTRITRNGNCSCVVRFVDVTSGVAKNVTHGILKIDTEYKARQEANARAVRERLEELEKLDNQAIYELAKSEDKHCLNTRLAWKIMACRLNSTEYYVRKMLMYNADFDAFEWE